MECLCLNYLFGTYPTSAFSPFLLTLIPLTDFVVTMRICSDNYSLKVLSSLEESTHKPGNLHGCLFILNLVGNGLSSGEVNLSLADAISIKIYVALYAL